MDEDRCSPAAVLDFHQDHGRPLHFMDPPPTHAFDRGQGLAGPRRYAYVVRVRVPSGEADACDGVAGSESAAADATPGRSM